MSALRAWSSALQIAFGSFAEVAMTSTPCWVSVLMKLTCEEALASVGPTSLYSPLISSTAFSPRRRRRSGHRAADGWSGSWTWVPSLWGRQRTPGSVGVDPRRARGSGGRRSPAWSSATDRGGDLGSHHGDDEQDTGDDV